jgi:hypothetical protein
MMEGLTKPWIAPIHHQMHFIKPQYALKMPYSAEDGQNFVMSTVLGREEAWTCLSQPFPISPHYEYEPLQVCLH